MQTAEGLQRAWLRGPHLFTLHNDSLRVWKIENSVDVARLDLRPDVTAEAVSQDGTTLAIARGGRIEVYTFVNGNFSRTLDVDDHDGQVNALAFSTDGSVLISGGNDQTIRKTDAIAALRGERRVIDVQSGPMLDVTQLVSSREQERC